MRLKVGLIIILCAILSACTNNETIVEGKIEVINPKEKTAVIYVGDTLTEKQRNNFDFDEYEKYIEAFLVQMDKSTVIDGEVESISDLTIGQKVKVEIKGEYEKELVTPHTLYENQSKLPDYKPEKITVIPYTKQEIVKEMTVDEGNYGLFIYNLEPNEKGKIGDFPEAVTDAHFQVIHTVPSTGSKVKNTKELLGLYEDSPTYIVTDDKEIIYKTDNEESLVKFVKSLETRE
ncbi:hypothetical protein VBD025_16630 [Virgibacillus flavescens]|uniref:hypothetical protein n=1 Tax=Virgibacillus flavescens TaxID=1611422 RepID=UPI003D3311FD